MFLIGKHEWEIYFFVLGYVWPNQEVVMSNSMKAQAIKDLHYSWYLKIHFNCTNLIGGWRILKE